MLQCFLSDISFSGYSIVIIVMTLNVVIQIYSNKILSTEKNWAERQ